MEKLDIEKFNPTMAELTKRVASSQKITVKDLRDTKQIALVQESRKSLRGFEIKIERTGKELRREARNFASSVIGREKELKAITSPEIERLKMIEEESEAVLLKDKRLKNLPHRKKELEKIGDNIEIGDEYILSLDLIEFKTYINQRVADKNEKDRIDEENRAKMARAKVQAEQDAQAKKLDEEKEALRIKEQEAQDKIDEANRKLEADKLELQHQKELQEADKRAKEEAEKKQEADRLKVIEDKKKEDEELKKRKAYIEFLKENGCTNLDDENFHIEHLDTKMVLYKKVGEFKI